MTRTLLPLASIIVSDRLRKDYGEDEMEQLCDSIQRYGLIQPLVVDQNKNLIAGGRRYAAVTALGWTEVDVFFKESLSTEYLHELELEENIQRKQMTWQEEVCATAIIHNLKVTRNALEGKDWGMRQTGLMLNMALGKVSHTVAVASRINAGDEAIIACDGLTSAIKLLWKRDEEAAQKELSARSLAAAVANAEPDIELTYEDGDGVRTQLTTPRPIAEVVVPLTKTVLRQPDLSFSVLRSLPNGCVDHCITDPPYGIDMANLAQENQGVLDVDSVAESHDVKKNQAMFPEMFREVYRVTKEGAFFCLWCDIMNWQFLYDCAIAAGWRVQRWPIVWYKTHQCLNQMAQYNFTKDFEIAMVCRKPKAMMFCSSITSVVQASNQSVKERYGSHPFVKPPECWDILMKVAAPGDTILEPFAGRGSGVIRMLEARQKVIAIEYDETHYAYLVENVKRFYLLKNPNTKFV